MNTSSNENSASDDGMTRNERDEWLAGIREGERTLRREINVFDMLVRWTDQELSKATDVGHVQALERNRQRHLETRQRFQWQLDHYLYKTPKERAKVMQEKLATDPEFSRAPTDAELAELMSKSQELNERKVEPSNSSPRGSKRVES
jgi:hypothetical protein